MSDLPEPQARPDRPWRRLGDGLYRLFLCALLVGITALAGEAAQYHWNLEDVRWLRGVTAHLDADQDVVAQARRIADPASQGPLSQPLSPEVDGLATPLPLVPGRDSDEVFVRQRPGLGTPPGPVPTGLR